MTFSNPTKCFQPPHKTVILRGCDFFHSRKMMAVDAERRPASATVLSPQPPSPICHPDRREGPAVRPSVDPHLPFAATRFFVILEACDVLIFLCFSHSRPDVFNPSTKPSSCLPRRAVGAKRLADLSHNEGLWREVEGPRRCLLADAIQSFSATDYEENLRSAVKPAWR